MQKNISSIIGCVYEISEFKASIIKHKVLTSGKVGKYTCVEVEGVGLIHFGAKKKNRCITHSGKVYFQSARYVKDYLISVLKNKGYVNPEVLDALIKTTSTYHFEEQTKIKKHFQIQSKKINPIDIENLLKPEVIIRGFPILDDAKAFVEYYSQSGESHSETWLSENSDIKAILIDEFKVDNLLNQIDVKVTVYKK